jgi:hypothetical protein
MPPTYKPLDLSFLANYNSMQPDSNQNVAQMLLANGGWSDLSQKSLSDIAAYNHNLNAPHRVSGISRVLDLLSTPTYGIANAALEAVINHQKDNHDSVLSELGGDIGGAFKGAGQGLAAGLRGTFGSDAAAANPKGKTRFNDVINQAVLHMSTEQALDPANKEKVRHQLETMKVNQFGGSGKDNLQYPNGVSDKDIENFFKLSGILGIGNDIVSDPLNLISPAGAYKSVKNLVTGGRKTADIAEGLRGINNASKFDLMDRATGVPSSGYTRDLSAKLNPAPATASAPTLSAPELSAPAAVAPTLENASPLGKMLRNSRVVEYPGKGSKFYRDFRTKTIPAEGIEIPIKAQKQLSSKILTHIQADDPQWLYKAVDELRRVGGTRDFAQTQAFLENVQKVARNRKIPAKQFMKQLAVDLPRRISEDVKGMRANANARAVVAAKDLVNSGPVADVILQNMASLPKRLNEGQANVAFNTIRKYQSRILGNAAPTTERIPGAMNRAIQTGMNARYSGPQQVNMYQTILHNLKYGNSRKFSHATEILAQVEKYFKSKGAIPFSAIKLSDGHNLDLSRVLKAIGPEAAVMNRSLLTKILAGNPEAIATLPAEAVQRIEALKAGEALASAPGIKAGIEHGKQLGDLVAKAPLAPARKIPMAENVIKNTKLAAQAAGGGEAGAYIAGQYIRNHFNLAGPVNMVYKSGKLDTTAALAEAARNDAKFLPVNPKQVTKLNRSLSTAMESPPVRELGKVTGPAARVADWFGARFNAGYGNADFRPEFLKAQASAYSTAALRSRYINGLRRTYGSDPDMWSAAMKSAQGNLAPIGDTAIDGLAKEIQKTMESLFGGSGIREGAMAEATVAARMRLTINELNANLKRFGLGGFTFTRGTVKDAAGISQDYSRGIDWLKSWESWTIQEPYKFLHQIQSAVEYAAREKIMFDEIASRFGSFTKLGTGKDAVKYGINHPRLKGVYFTEEGARQGEQFLKILKQVNDPTSKGLQHVQHVMSKFKAAVTIYWPVHHVNNMIGDTFMNWYAGVNSLTPYTMAMKVMRSQKGMYKDIKELGMLTGPNALKEAIQASQSSKMFAERAVGNKTLFVMRRGGERVSNDMVAAAARKMGILPSGRVLEDIQTDVSGVLDKIGLPGKFRGRGQQFVHSFSETRDHFPRYAQFIDHLMKSTKSFEDSIEEAAAAVRKWHPDGLDLTKFERNTLRAVLPFYSWMRKAIPLSIETALTVPGKVKAYPQLMEAIQIYNGVNPEDNLSQPFPTDQLFPDWMREKGIGPIMGGRGNYTVINPSVPANDVLSSIFTPQKTIEGYLNPLIKVPVEMLQGHEMMTNQGIGGINNQSYLDYMLKQTPVISNVGRMTGQFGVSQAGAGTPEWIKLLNLIGARAADSGQYQKSAQFDLRDYLKSRSK